MSIGKVLTICGLCLSFAACGGGSTGGGGRDGGVVLPPTPVDHTLAQLKPVTFSAGGYYGFEFLLPSAAQVSFSVSEQTTDTWNIGVFSNTEWTCYQSGSCNQAYTGAHSNVMNVTDTVAVPAGDWYLGFKCTNSIERCMINFNLDAEY